MPFGETPASTTPEASHTTEMNDMPFGETPASTTPEASHTTEKDNMPFGETPASTTPEAFHTMEVGTFDNRFSSTLGSLYQFSILISLLSSFSRRGHLLG
jgi:hypothetical protein